MSKSSFIGKHGSSHDIQRLIDEGDADAVRAASHRNPAWSDAHTDAAVKSEHASIRTTMAHFHWDKLHEGHRDALLRDPNEYVRKRAHYSHLSTKTGDELVKFMHDPSTKDLHQTAYSAGANENIFHSRHLKIMMNHPDPRIRVAADNELYNRGSDDY